MLRVFILISAHCALWNENEYLLYLQSSVYISFHHWLNSQKLQSTRLRISEIVYLYIFYFDSFSLTSCFRNARKFEFGAFTVDNISYFQNFTYRKTAKMSDDENAPPPTSASKKAKKVSTPNSIRASLSSPLQALRAFTSLSNRGSVKSPVSKSSPLGKFFSSKVRWKSHLGPPS